MNAHQIGHKAQHVESLFWTLHKINEYVSVIQSDAENESAKIEAEDKCIEMQSKKSMYDETFVAYVQRCTDLNKCETVSAVSKRSSRSSKSRKTDYNELHKLKVEGKLAMQEMQLAMERAETKRRIEFERLQAEAKL